LNGSTLRAPIPVMQLSLICLLHAEVEWEQKLIFGSVEAIIGAPAGRGPHHKRTPSGFI